MTEIVDLCDSGDSSISIGRMDFEQLRVELGHFCADHVLLKILRHFALENDGAPFF
ncbi:MAG: hypothetical protein GY820_45380 [Gammaproteobacteria bacterium]|nr:hypothetical protein [Gammaproteobacteria bacterium]